MPLPRASRACRKPLPEEARRFSYGHKLRQMRELALKNPEKFWSDILGGEPGDRRALTYMDLWKETCRFSAALRDLGVGKGNRVVIHMPMMPVLPIAMPTCARIGSHSALCSSSAFKAARKTLASSVRIFGSMMPRPPKLL